MRKKIILSAIVIIFAHLTGMAQKENKRSFIAKGVEWVKGYLDATSKKGIDTTYVYPPKYGWLGYMSINFAGIKSTVIGNDIPVYGDVKISLRSSLKGQSTISLGYRGLSFYYSWNLFGKYSKDASFSLFKNSWGVEYRRHSTDGVHGTLYSSTTGKTLNIGQGDINVKTTLIDGYVIFNSRKFSYPAALYQNLIQKRSAGSFLLVGGYINSSITTGLASLEERLGGIKEIEVSQGALGIGYGYNYAINNGQILLHASAIPMAVIHDNNLVTLDYATKLADGTTYTTEISKKVESKRKVYFTGVFRTSASYNICDRFLIGIDGVLNDIRFKSKSGLSIKAEDWYCDLMIGMRF